MSRITREDNSSEYSRQIYESLPDNAKQYFVEKTDKQMKEISYQLNLPQTAWRYLNLARIYPFFSLQYLNSNELCCAVVNGDHRIYQGPGSTGWSVLQMPSPTGIRSVMISYSAPSR